MARSAFRTRRLVCVIAALAIACSAPATASAGTPGQVDPAFGHLHNGTVLADHGRFDFVIRMLRQSSGKIVVVSTGTTSNFATTIVVSRYSPNGVLDTSFGHGGTFVTPLPGGVAGSISDAALQPDDKIVIVGWTDPPANFLVMRLTANGAVDPSFVTAHPTTNFGPNTFDQALAVAIGTGGKIVVAGRSDKLVAIARYTSTGALDPTFSGDGLVTRSFGTQSEADSVVVLAGGRIVVGGREFLPNGTGKLVLARFNTNGSLDATFGAGGRVDPASTPLQAADTLILQGTKLVVAGSITTAMFAMSRFTGNGAIDNTFGSAGTTTAQVGRFLRLDVITDSGGHLVAVGQAAYHDNFPGETTFVVLIRYSTDGIRDESFGCRGRVYTQVLGNGAGKSYEASAGESAIAIGNDIVIGGFAAHFDGTDFPQTDNVFIRYAGASPEGSGYALVRADGGSSAFGGAPACGFVQEQNLSAPIVGSAFDPAAAGNWSVASDGSVFPIGYARSAGSMRGVPLAAPIVGIAAAPDGNGYWLVASDGGVFAFGSARFFGSTGAIHLNKPIVGIAAAKDGKGYWLAASDGGVFAFGSARFAGSMGGVRLAQPVVGIAADHDGAGYWLVARDGGIFSFDAKFSGSTGAIHLAQPIVGMAADRDGTGYWLAAADGGVFSFDARFSGSTGATPFPAGSARTTIGIAARP